MSEQDNLQLVKQIYAAFGEEGDIAGGTPTTLDLLTEDSEWEFSGRSEFFPWAGVRKGRDGAAAALATLDELLEFEEFAPQQFLAQGDTVVVLGYERIRVRATGRSFTNTWTHVLKLREGKVLRLRTYDDTAEYLTAMREE